MFKLKISSFGRIIRPSKFPLDFSLEAYRQILSAIEFGGYKIVTAKSLKDGWPAEPSVFLRHDVDRMPRRAVAMAKLESIAGISSAYYFRCNSLGKFPYDAISKIYSVGHEVGYHYEDFSRCYGNSVNASNRFLGNLNQLRSKFPVDSICPHGSPLSKFDNRSIWLNMSYELAGVVDLGVSLSHDGVAYVTDSSRSFGNTHINFRDYIPGSICDLKIKNVHDLIFALKERRYSVWHINIHPERWTGNNFSWIIQFIKDYIFNLGKKILFFYRALNCVSIVDSGDQSF